MPRPARRYHYLVRLPLLSAIVILLGMGIFARRGWLDWRKIAQKNEELRQRIELLTQQKQDLARQEEAFATDKEEQKRVVRQRLGFVSKDETILEFD